MLLAGHACDRFFSKPSARLAWQFHFPLSSRCNHGGISDGAAGAVPGLPPGRGTFVNDVIMLVVAVVTAARGLQVATSMRWTKIEGLDVSRFFASWEALCPLCRMRGYAHDTGANRQ